MRLIGRYVWTLGKQRMHFFRVAHLKLSRVSARAATQDAQSITALQELLGRKHTRWSWSPHPAWGHLGLASMIPVVCSRVKSVKVDVTLKL